MKIATHVARILLGAVFLMSGVVGLFNLVPMPEMEEGPAAFLQFMIKSGYLMKLVKGTEIVCGALLLANRFVPLALVMLAPLLVNIALFHAFLTPPKDLIGTVIFLTIYGFLVWRYQASFMPLFTAKTNP